MNKEDSLLFVARHHSNRSIRDEAFLKLVDGCNDFNRLIDLDGARADISDTVRKAALRKALIVCTDPIRLAELLPGLPSDLILPFADKAVNLLFGYQKKGPVDVLAALDVDPTEAFVALGDILNCSAPSLNTLKQGLPARADTLFRSIVYSHIIRGQVVQLDEFLKYFTDHDGLVGKLVHPEIFKNAELQLSHLRNLESDDVTVDFLHEVLNDHSIYSPALCQRARERMPQVVRNRIVKLLHQSDSNSSFSEALRMIGICPTEHRKVLLEYVVGELLKTGKPTLIEMFSKNTMFPDSARNRLQDWLRQEARKIASRYHLGDGVLSKAPHFTHKPVPHTVPTRRHPLGRQGRVGAG